MHGAHGGWSTCSGTCARSRGLRCRLRWHGGRRRRGGSAAGKHVRERLMCILCDDAKLSEALEQVLALTRLCHLPLGLPGTAGEAKSTALVDDRLPLDDIYRHRPLGPHVILLPASSQVTV